MSEDNPTDPHVVLDREKDIAELLKQSHGAVVRAQELVVALDLKIDQLRVRIEKLKTVRACLDDEEVLRIMVEAFAPRGEDEPIHPSSFPSLERSLGEDNVERSCETVGDSGQSG